MCGGGNRTAPVWQWIHCPPSDIFLEARETGRVQPYHSLQGMPFLRTDVSLYFSLVLVGVGGYTE